MVSRSIRSETWRPYEIEGLTICGLVIWGLGARAGLAGSLVSERAFFLALFSRRRWAVRDSVGSGIIGESLSGGLAITRRERRVVML